MGCVLINQALAKLLKVDAIAAQVMLAQCMCDHMYTSSQVNYNCT